MRNLLKVEDLKVHYNTAKGIVKAVDGINFFMDKGEVVSLVGESGSGKTTLGLSLLRLVPPPGKIVSGKVLFDGMDLTKLDDEKISMVRGRRISMIFQDPTSSLDPLEKVGDHLVETIMTHEDISKEDAEERARSILLDVGISPKRFHDYPHQFSGGMRQRVGIALAFILNPDLVIADEPTSSLDVTIQSQILDLMRELKKSYGMSMILITHDISVGFEIADKVALMYAGHLIEFADAVSFHKDHLHPYAEMLLQSVPNVQVSDQELKYIPGVPPDMVNPPSGCRFHPRCPYAENICRKEEPPLVSVEEGHSVKCFRYG